MVRKLILSYSLLFLLYLSGNAKDPETTDQPLVVVSDFQTTIQEDQLSVTWAAITQQYHRYFTLERAGMDMQFEVVAIVNSKVVNQMADYLITDYKPVSELTFYRLMSTDIEGNSHYHGIITQVGTSPAPVSDINK